MSEKNYRVRILDVAEDGTETLHTNDEGVVAPGAEDLCTGYVVIRFSAEDKEAGVQGCQVSMHDVTGLQLMAAIAASPELRRAAEMAKLAETLGLGKFIGKEVENNV